MPVLIQFVKCFWTAANIVRKNASDPWSSIWEIQVFSTNGSNLALASTVSCGSNHEAELCEYVKDNITFCAARNCFWTSQTLTRESGYTQRSNVDDWMIMDLGVPTAVEMITIFLHGNRNQYMQTIAYNKVNGSDIVANSWIMDDSQLSLPSITYLLTVDGIDDTMTRFERTLELQASQSESLYWLLLFGGILFTETLGVIVLSKCCFRDKDCDYWIVVFFNLSLFDVTSDIFFLISLHNITILKDNEIFRPYFFFGTIMLGLMMLANVIFSSKAVLAERARSTEFRKFISNHCFAVIICQVLSAIKPNLINLLTSRLFLSCTTVFTAPVPSPYSPIQLHMRLLKYLTLFGEDTVQMIIVLSLQTSLLGGWTTMNTITFSASASSLLAGLSITKYQLCKLKKEFTLDKMMKTTELDRM